MNITPHNGNNQINGNRRVPSNVELQALISQQIVELFKIGKPFTAYTITLRLRNNNPNLEIVHTGQDGVREFTHNLMLNINFAKFPFSMDHRLWGASGIDGPNGESALTYIPTVITINTVDENDEFVIEKTPTPVLPSVVGQGNVITFTVDKSDNDAKRKGVFEIPLINLDSSLDIDEDKE